MQPLKLSPLPKTWLLDVDGTLVIHNGHLEDNERLLGGVREFFSRIDKADRVILLTSRGPEYASGLEEFLRAHGIPFDQILYGLPFGERILVNDTKPSGLKTAYAVNNTRNGDFVLPFEVDGNL